MQTDNSTAVGIVNNTIKRQKSRSMEMRYFWLLDTDAQKMFSFHYQPGQENLGDYVTKHHASIHHTAVCPTYLTPKQHLDMLRARAAAQLATRNVAAKVA